MRLFSDSIGRKAVMAITGLLMVLFVVGHLLGNLSIFAGPDGLNSYAEHLHALWPVVWITRVVMGVAVLLHLVLSIQITLENSQAKPEKYAVTNHLRATFAQQEHDLDGRDHRRVRRVPPAPLHLPRHAGRRRVHGRGPRERLRDGHDGALERRSPAWSTSSRW